MSDEPSGPPDPPPPPPIEIEPNWREYEERGGSRTEIERKND